MMTQRLHIILIASALLVFFNMMRMVIKGRLQLRYTLMWGASGLCLIILSIKPIIITFTSRILGIYDDSNTLFLMINFVLFMLSLVFTISMSRNNDRIVQLTQEIAIIKNQVNEMQKEKD